MKSWAMSCGLPTILLLLVMLASAQDAETLSRATSYEPLMIAAGKRHGVDPRLIWAVAYLETRFRPEQVSRAGARGMMQFMPATANRYGLKNPHDPASSIDAAARYLRDLQAMFAHRIDLVLAAYNSGEYTVMAFRDGRRLVLSNGKILNPNGIKTGGVPPYRETCGYVRSGVALYLGLAARNDFGPINRSSLRLQDELKAEGAEDPVPEEVIELKQGSIYVVKELAPADTPILPQSSATRSIYSQ